MASIRSKIYSRLLRRALRGGILPGGESGLALARSGENRGPILSMIMGKEQPGTTLKIGSMDAEWVGDLKAERTLLYLQDR